MKYSEITLANKILMEKNSHCFRSWYLIVKVLKFIRQKLQY